MSDEEAEKAYTPSETEVREAYQMTGDGLDFKKASERRGEEFDRWLAAVKRETAAQALEDAAKNLRLGLSGHSGVSITRLRERAAALRSGTEGGN